MKKSRGVTMIELVVSLAIIGGTTLGIVRVTQVLNRMGSNNLDKQLMNSDAEVLLSAMSARIKNAGDGMTSSQNLIGGQTALALPDNALDNISPSIIFLSKDNAPTGLGAEDYWTSYSTATQNGEVGIIEKTYQSSNWLTIKAGTATLIQSRFLRTQKSIKLSSLSFIFYDGQFPPQIANQSPQATSAVRIMIKLTSPYSTCTRENTVNLDTLIYGPH